MDIMSVLYYRIIVLSHFISIQFKCDEHQLLYHCVSIWMIYDDSVDFVPPPLNV